MADFFKEYELLAQSGLFDAEYYIGANPDVAALSIDPLMHYLEKGASELRNPNNYFDARHYVGICEQRGEHVENPLLHYIKYGATQRLATRPDGVIKDRTVSLTSTAPAAVPTLPMEFLLKLDEVRIEPGSGADQLIGFGWCLAASPIIELQVALGSVRERARYGFPRIDVAQAYPQYLKSDHSGFEFNLGPIREDQIGNIELQFTALLAFGAPANSSVRIDLRAVRAQAQQIGASTSLDSGISRFRQPPMQLCIDMAEVDATGILHVVGWAVCLAPISFVQVLIGGEKFATAEYGNPREDVALSHPEYPNSRLSGFALHADITAYGDGDYVVKVQAIASTGITRETILPFTFRTGGRALVRDPNISNVQCFCDAIEITSSGRVSIDGWAVASAPPERISVLLDGRGIGDAELGIERPDVGNRFPGLAHARKAGFSFRCTLPAVGGGEHLVVLGYLAGGKVTDIPLPVLAVLDSVLTDDGNAQPASESGELILSIDLPQVVDGSVVAPVRSNLEIAGWALARKGIDFIEISIDGLRVKTATTGIRRIDVQRALPDWDSALTAGFSTLLPHRSMLRGPHSVSIVVKDKVGQTTKSEFRIVVEDATDAGGPWALRRKIALAEVNLLSRPLLNRGKRPSISVVLVVPTGARAAQQTRKTLKTLATQAYDNWRVHIVTRSHGLTVRRRPLLEGLGELSERVNVLADPGALKTLLTTGAAASLIMVLKPGDELGCDAMLEFAVHTAMYPQADFFYCDARQLNSASGKVDAFFKPEWSPDLLHSQNYLGRAWCANVELLQRADIRAVELVNSGSYHLALRLTEHAREIRHVHGTLLEENAEYAEAQASEHKALERALVRRKIFATVKAGRTPGTFRVRRRIKARAMVSIIIPTCAARGLVGKCIETIRRVTKYRAFEIVCIENIPEEKPEWKVWVRANADTVIKTSEAFNWSRFNNIAAAASRGEFLLFLNDDIEIIDPEWLGVLLENVARPDIGVIGPQLLYPDRRVQHAGMFLAGMGVARHAFRYGAEDDPGYFGLALAQREVISVTGACLMTRRDTFEASGGFDETHDVVNNDVDYCLRVWRRGLRTIYTPHTRLIHHELASRSELADHYDVNAFQRKWRSTFADGDPYFHPRLAKDRDDYSYEWEPVEIHCVGHPLFLRDTIRRILIVKLDHIGDCVTALPAIRKLKRHFPEARLCVLTGRASRAIWALESVVDDVIEFDFFNARSASGLVERSEDDWHQLREQLAVHRFDLAIDLRKHWETRHVLRFTEARYLAGFDMKGKFPWLDIAMEWSEDSALLRKRLHTTDDLVNLVDAVAAAGDPDRQVIANGPVALSQGDQASTPLLRQIFRKRVVCVHASVGNEMRQWPAEHFSLLIDLLLECESVHVILIGGPDEEALGAKVLESLTARRFVWSLIGKVKLSELPALISRCALFVGNNSGPHHIAAGLGVPTVGIHSGVVDAREWGPKGESAVAVNRVMTCAPCYLLKPEDCGRGLACLRGLLPADVLRVCRRLLVKSAANPKVVVRGVKLDSRRTVN